MIAKRRASSNRDGRPRRFGCDDDYRRLSARCRQPRLCGGAFSYLPAACCIIALESREAHHRTFIIILPQSLEDQRQRTETSLPSDAASIAAAPPATHGTEIRAGIVADIALYPVCSPQWRCRRCCSPGRRAAPAQRVWSEMVRLPFALPTPCHGSSDRDREMVAGCRHPRTSRSASMPSTLDPWS